MWKKTNDPEAEEETPPLNPTNNATFASVLAVRLSRRSLLQGGAASLVLFSAGALRPSRAKAAPGEFAPITPTTEDGLIVPPGYTHTVLLRWGDPLAPDVPELDPMAQTAGKQARQFGYNCDFIGYLPLPYASGSSARGLLVVNHEFVNPELMFPSWDGKVASKTREIVEVEIAAHGLSVVEVALGAGGRWTVVRNSPHNRRITGSSPMLLRGPAAGHALLRTSADPSGMRVMGTLNN